MPTRLVLFLALAPGCLTPKPDDDADDSEGGGGGDSAGIFAINDGTIPMDTVVTLEDVVVTSPFTRDSEGFFIADPAGGAGSGLYVWGPSAVAELMVDGAVSQGKSVTITGQLSDYYGWIELTIGAADDVVVNGDGTLPPAVDLGDGAGVDWSLYKSALVTISDQSIVSMDEYSTAMLSGGVALDDGFQYLEHDCGGQYESVAGIVFYSYETYSINPRADGDLVGYTGGGSSAATVYDVQTGGSCGTVELGGLVVTSPVAFDGEDSTVFVQDEGGGEYTGVAVFVPGVELDLSVGDVIDVTGSVSEYYGFTEVFVADASGVSVVDGGATPVATDLDAAPDDWEPYEGCLLTLADVEVTGDEDDYGELPTNYEVLLDDLFVDAGGDAWSQVTGVFLYGYEDWRLAPRTAADLQE